MLLSVFLREGAHRLEALYPPGEARSLVDRLSRDLCGFKPYDHIVRPDLEAPEDLSEALERLMAGEPLQYVVGWTEFYGRRFNVSPGVLIPRPETEILVREACVRALNSREPRVLDLCTGSGCIAWSIALEVPEAKVLGVDISDDALQVARAQKPCLLSTEGVLEASPYAKEAVSEYGEGGNGASVLKEQEICERNPLFVRADVLEQGTFPGRPFDIIVANPPYIKESEKAAMHRNVLEHEPSMALFVPDEDPLLFYRAIAGIAARSLVPGGWGMVEINEALGRETAAVFEAAGLRKVQVFSDFFGRDRFVSFVL